MNIIIVGGGKVGINLTALLSEEGHDVTVIDTVPRLIENIVNDYDVIGYCGNGAAYMIQSQAGVGKCDIFIAVTGSDELNIMSCIVAEKLGAKHSVARVRNPEYSRQTEFMRTKLGVDLIINPELEAANEIARIIEFPSATKIEHFAKGRVELCEVTVASDSVLCDMALFDMKKKLNAAMLICAVQRGEELIIPSGNFIIKSGDRIHFTASRSEIIKIFKILGLQKKKIKSALIVGGSRTSYYLCQRLSSSGIDVKLIESDPERASVLEAELDGITVICGDGTDTDILKEEGLENFDASVALTDIDEENLIMSMYAHNVGVKKTICKINRSALSGMFTSVISDCSVVSPKALTSGTILRYVRAVNNSSGNQIKMLYRIVDGQAEALEFIAAENCKLNGKTLKELKLKPNIIIACVTHGNNVIIPDGNTAIESGDSVIVITGADRAIGDLNEILL